MVDAAACLVELLKMAGTEASVVWRGRLAARLVVLHALVGSRVWTPGIPEVEDFENLTAGVWFYETPDVGPDEHGEDCRRAFCFTCLGGRVGGVSTGVMRPRDAEAVARAVMGVLSVVEGMWLTAGTITAAGIESGFAFGVDEKTGWPYWKFIGWVEVGE